MKRNLLKYLGAGVLGSLIPLLDLNAQVVQTNTITFSGTCAVNTGSLSNATAFTSFSSVTVVAGQEAGSYVGTGGTSNVTFNSFTFNPPAASVKPLWTFTANGKTYSFDATSLTNEFQNSMALDIQGSGVAHITGQFDMAGSWVLAVDQSGGLPVVLCTITATNTPIRLGCSWATNICNLILQGPVGSNYVIQVSTNLSSWGPLTNFITTSSPFYFKDSAATNKYRFYRAYVP